jgi:hypothetical protein
MVKRIVPDPTPRAGDASRDVWGFRDSGFVVDDAGHFTFRGARYAISGKRNPRLLPLTPLMPRARACVRAYARMGPLWKKDSGRPI